MYRKFFSKMTVVILWIMISIGIYQCSTNTGQEKKLEQPQEETTSLQIEDVQVQEQTLEQLLSGKIRVLIKTSEYGGIYHDEIVLSGTGDLVVSDGENSSIYKAGDRVWFQTGQLQGDKVIVTAVTPEDTILLGNVTRKEAVQYRGSMECIQTEQGLVLVNELLLEEYLYGVLPSEMPSSYPIEALKAQAISARSYALYHMKSYAYPQWQVHVDDSTDYQVYLNIGETEQVRQAVDETKGQIMTYQGEVIESFYYATSSGYSAGYEVWDGTKERAYLQAKALTRNGKAQEEQVIETFSSKEEHAEQRYREYLQYGRSSDIEYQEPWYRWRYQKKVDAVQLLQRLADRIQRNPELVAIHVKQEAKNQVETVDEQAVNQTRDRIEQLVENKESILSIEVAQRLENGLVNQLYIETQKYEIVCKTQQLIRQILAAPQDRVVRQDDSEYTLGELLPSGYFCLDMTKNQNGEVEQLTILGGGFGHGAGMSQNGAKCLAQAGMTAQEILKTYYTGIDIETVHMIAKQ